MMRCRKRFPQRERMRTGREFDQVRQYGRAKSGRFLVLSLLRHRMVDSRRSGFIVSKRLGNAVMRNRIKRRLREIYRTHRAQLVPEIWMVLIARQTAREASYRELEHEFIQLYQSGVKEYPS